MSISTFLANNAGYVATRPAHHNVGPLHHALTNTLVITCFDPRVNPETFLGIENGKNMAQVARIAGGRASSGGVEALVIGQRLAGITEILVLHHTDCGGLHGHPFKNPAVADWILHDSGFKKGAGDAFRQLQVEKKREIDRPGMLEEGEKETDTLNRRVKEDVEFLKAHPLVRTEVSVRGGYYDIATGEVVMVV